MSFKDLEKKTKKVEDNKDVKLEVGTKKVAPDLPDPVVPANSARGAAPLAQTEDLFDNMPI